MNVNLVPLLNLFRMVLQNNPPIMEAILAREAYTSALSYKYRLALSRFNKALSIKFLKNKNPNLLSLSH